MKGKIRTALYEAVFLFGAAFLTVTLVIAGVTYYPHETIQGQ